MIPVALQNAIKATREAGWELPLRAQRSTYAPLLDSTEVVEADGTRVCIVGTRLDAELIVAAMNYVLNESPTTYEREKPK